MMKKSSATFTCTEARVLEVLKSSGPANGIHRLAWRVEGGTFASTQTLNDCLNAVRSLQSEGRISVTKKADGISIALKKPLWVMPTIAVSAIGSLAIVAGCTTGRVLPSYGPQPVPAIHPAQFHNAQGSGNFWSYCDGPHCPDPTPKTYKTDDPAPVVKPTKKELVSLSADVLFDFDSAHLKPKGREVLDRLTDRLTTRSIKEVQVLGYTDRLGSDKYNIKLSQRRADVVRVFLSTKLPGVAIEAFGRGKSNPITGTTCPGSMSTGKLRDCLQADRRVEINLTHADE